MAFVDDKYTANAKKDTARGVNNGWAFYPEASHDTIDKDKPLCYHCYRKIGILRCSACNEYLYCSVSCQKKDWNHVIPHKITCQLFRAESREDAERMTMGLRPVDPACSTIPMSIGQDIGDRGRMFYNLKNCRPAQQLYQISFHLLRKFQQTDAVKDQLAMAEIQTDIAECLTFKYDMRTGAPWGNNMEKVLSEATQAIEYFQQAETTLQRLHNQIKKKPKDVRRHPLWIG